MSLFSLADSLHRIRRIKCGEERPNCLRCVKSGWQCDGYGKSKRNTANPPIDDVPNLFLSTPTPTAEEEPAAGTANEEVDRITKG